MLESWSLHNRFLNPSSSSDASSSSTKSRSSHLSILTSTSSISSALSDSGHPDGPSPLPSPAHSGSSKTNAFFGSPFAEGSSSPPPPANPPSRASSVKSSRNADFFGTPSTESALSPPPSIRSLSQHASPVVSPANSPPSSPPPTGQKKHLPPMARFFPSRQQRYNTVEIDGLPSRQPSPARDASSSTRRDFLYFDSSHPPHSYRPPPFGPTAQEPVRPSETAPGSSSTSHWPGSPVELPADSSGLPTPLLASASASVSRHYPLSHQPSPHPESDTSLPRSETGPVPPPSQTQIHTQTETPPQTEPLHPNQLIGDTSLTLQLLRLLGEGAFSSVWLAREEGGKGQLGALKVERRSSLRRSRSKRMEGTVPKTRIKRRAGGSLRGKAREMEMGKGLSAEDRNDSQGSVFLSASEPVTTANPNANPSMNANGNTDVKTKNADVDTARLVAVKMMDRALCDKNNRTRVSFIREVEVLRHISHPSIVSYIHSFSTPSHHCLVLEHLSGGDLFDLIDHPEYHARLDERAIRRMFGELCKAVGWMHSVGLVHRDIKLENILLTAQLFPPSTSPDSSTPPANIYIPPLPAPLIKLTDFGLSRFIDPAHPLLTTRCGSESYAAPELVTGRAYDGRETDAWACGVVLYAMATRRLPFDVAGRERREGERERGGHRERRGEKGERRALLVRIAKGEYEWPILPDPDIHSELGNGVLRGVDLARSEGLRRVVGKLLVRDSKKRARVADLWEDEWMRGEGAPPPPVPQPPPPPPPPPELDSQDSEAVVEGEGQYGSRDQRRVRVRDFAIVPRGEDEGDGMAETNETDMTVEDTFEGIRVDPFEDQDEDEGVEDEEDEDEGEDEDGVLVDVHDIGPGSVARQEH